ncbi:MAG: hypothetical protein ACC707_03200 [Thiohalomonadales bacterium]
MHVNARFTTEYHAFKDWLNRSSDDFLFFCLQYIQKFFPARKLPEFLEKNSGDKRHQPQPGEPDKNLHVVQRSDTPMRENVTRFKKGKRLKR